MRISLEPMSHAEPELRGATTCWMVLCCCCMRVVPQWRIDNFSKLMDVRVYSECFEAGISTWRLIVLPNGNGDCTGTHLSVFLEAQHTMWAPKAECILSLLNQSHDNKKISQVIGMRAFTEGQQSSWGIPALMELSVLRDAAAGWLVKDTLVLKATVTVEREDRFQLDTGGVPCDVTLKLPCGAELPAVSHLLKMASPFFREMLEDVTGSAPIPVDGSFGTWTYILSHLYPLHQPPALDWGSAYTLLPTLHKYDFSKAITRLLIAFVKDQELDINPLLPKTYIITWLALAERLQLDELRELCLGKLRGATKDDLQSAIMMPGPVLLKRGVREEVAALSPKLLSSLLALCLNKNA
ncbi:hypothetical protein FOA52_003716 [Chlamydomonas sp. UWO 241]|nr:hypothetical protein FOA52_003716 [Chlamydomonas sp. UWO 241]